LIGHGMPARTGHDKSTMVVYQTHQDRPGGLLTILQEFNARGINLTKLESRPTKRELGSYCFFIDFEGHISDELVADVLRSLGAKHEVRFLGSYAAAGREAGARRQAAGKAWREASRWVDGLRARVQLP
jgi:prephenate dehydratase